jgi:hypothetical protein
MTLRYNPLARRVDLLLLPALLACGSGDLTLNEADPQIVAQKPAWAEVEPIIQRDCVPCHAGIDLGDGDDDDDDEGDEGDDKPAGGRLTTAASSNDPGLESCPSVVANLDDVVEEIFDDNSMPPGAWPRLSSRQKLIIERWIAAGASCD